MPSVRASRFAVPCGTIPSGTPVDASPSAQPRTVPSPPTATTRSAPSRAAPLAAATPPSALSVTWNSADQPCRFANSRQSGTNRPLTPASEPFTTNATAGIPIRGYPPPRRGELPAGAAGTIRPSLTSLEPFTKTVT